MKYGVYTYVNDTEKRSFYYMKGRSAVVRIIEYLLVLCISIGIFLLAVGIGFAMPVVDDFSFYHQLKLSDYYPNVILSSLQQAWEIYNQNQGAWLTNNLDLIVIAITRLNVYAVRLYLFLSYALFIYAIISVMALLKESFDEQWKRIAIMMIVVTVLFVGMNLTPAREELYWLIGAGGYTVPFSLALIGLRNYVLMLKEYSLKKLIIASICMMLASGGALNIAGLACALSLVAVIAYLFQKKIDRTNRDNIKKLLITCIPLIMGIISALINVAAPGYRKRLLLENSEGTNYLKAIIDTLRQILVRTYALVKYQYLILALVILFFAFIIMSQNGIIITGKQVLVTYLLSFFVLFVTTFPVCLGYGRTTGVDRILFLEDLEIVILVVFCTFITAIWIKKSYESKVKDINMVVLIPLMVLVAAININVIGIGDMMMYKTFVEFSNGTLSQFSQNTQYVLDSIEESQEDNLVLRINYVDSEVALGLGLSPDKEHWVNREMSRCFGKESISLIYDGE